MSRLLSIFLLILLTSCGSYPPDSTLDSGAQLKIREEPIRDEQVKTLEEQKRLHKIYRAWFKQGFLDAWNGRHVVIESEGLVGKSTDPDGEWALHEGHWDGKRAGSEARFEYELKRIENEKH